MDRRILKRISTWGKVSGIITMIIGAIHALLGLFAFIVGAIPGIITLILGYFMFKSGKEAGDYLMSESEYSLESLLDSYGKYLLTTGILMIISIVLVLLLPLIFGFGIFALLLGL